LKLEGRAKALAGIVVACVTPCGSGGVEAAESLVRAALVEGEVEVRRRHALAARLVRVGVGVRVRVRVGGRVGVGVRVGVRVGFRVGVRVGG